MRNSLPTIECPNSGFTLIELLVALLVGMILLAGFTAFYLSEQRALAHHKIEVETSQELRIALEQMSRDLRSARKDLTRDADDPATYPGAGATFLSADANEIEFQLDANDNSIIDPDGTGPNTVAVGLYEHKGFRLTEGSIEQYDASVTSDNWRPLEPLAKFVETLSFRYWKCGPGPGADLVELISLPVTSATDLNSIVRIDIAVTMQRQVIGGLPVTRTESESVRLRNVRCP